MKFTLTYSDNAELCAKLKSIAARFGYRMEKLDPGRLTVGELARLVHRPVSTVTRSLQRPSCPEFVSKRGKRRILWIEPNDRLISYLQNPPFGGRPTKENATAPNPMKNP